MAAFRAYTNPGVKNKSVAKAVEAPAFTKWLMLTRGAFQADSQKRI